MEADAALLRAPLEKAVETPARISTTSTKVSPTALAQAEHGAVAQAYYNKQEGVTRLTTETAGQWGSALAFAGGIFGLEVDVWMVRCRTTRSRTGAV